LTIFNGQVATCPYGITTTNKTDLH